MSERPSILSTGQMACLLIAVSTGSAIIFIPGPLIGIAGNGSWVSLCGSYAFGILTLMSILFLHRRHEGKGLVEYSRSLIGRTATALVMIPIAAMLLFATSAIIAGIGDFFTSGMMPKTPNYVFCSLSLLVVALTARAGIVIAARMFVLLVPVMIVFTIIVLGVAFSLYDWGRLLPLFNKGTGSILHGLFMTAGFPFGEVCFFSLILPFAGNEHPRLLRNRLLLAFSITGLAILAATLCTIAAFGAAAGHLNYSMYQLASNIEIGGTNQRIEAVIGVALILGSYMKATLYIIALNRLLVLLTGANDGRAYVVPLCLICTLLSVTLFQSPADFQNQVYRVWPFIVVSTGCVLIYFLAGLTWVRGRHVQPAKEVEP